MSVWHKIITSLSMVSLTFMFRPWEKSAGVRLGSTLFSKSLFYGGEKGWALWLLVMACYWEHYKALSWGYCVYSNLLPSFTKPLIAKTMECLFMDPSMSGCQMIVWLATSKIILRGKIRRGMWRKWQCKWNLGIFVFKFSLPSCRERAEWKSDSSIQFLSFRQDWSFLQLQSLTDHDFPAESFKTLLCLYW